MEIRERSRHLFTPAVLLIFAGCGGSGLQAAPPAGLTDVAARTAAPQHSGHPRSWMAQGLAQRDLLYVSNGNGTVNVYRYWQHTLAGVLTDFTDPKGACSDQIGNVYITDYNFGYDKGQVSEYAHGGKKPIHVIRDSHQPFGCSVDSKTGNLAVADFGRYYSAEGDIAIYPRGQGNPMLLRTSRHDNFTSCAYDDRGDLLATGIYGYEFYYTEFYYLPRHGTQLIAMDLPGGRSSGWGDIQGIAWDGKYWVVVYDNELLRYKINLQAEHVDTINLSTGSYGGVGAVALFRNGKGLASQAVSGSNEFSGKTAVEFWKYPAGGNPVAQITQHLDKPFGVAISLHP